MKFKNVLKAIGFLGLAMIFFIVFIPFDPGAPSGLVFILTITASFMLFFDWDELEKYLN